jgi:phosphodiesterase/alkaline phosphatase D-like protein
MRARRSIPTMLVTLGVLAVAITAPAALAAPPEAPETLAATGVTTSGATLHGVLNPGGPSEGGGYRFTYKPSPSECEPEGTFRPEAPALSLGKAKEAVSVTLTGLEPDREYTFCVVASNLSAEPTTGSAKTFTTLALPPSIDAESVSVGSTSATLEAQVNPNNQATSYVFQYATKATGETLEGTIITLPGGEPLPAQFGDASATVPRIEGLTSGKTYFYRVTAQNAQSEKEAIPVKGKVKSFTTVPVPTTEAATAVTATTATFHGKLAPLNTVDTKYFFDYRVGEEGCAGEGNTTPEDAGTGTGTKTVSSNATGLQPKATYSVCLVSSNAFGSEVDPANPPKMFKTPPAPPRIEEQFADNLTPFSVVLNAFINPDNEKTTWAWEYATEEAKLGTPAATVVKGESPFEPSYSSEYARLETGNILTPDTTYYYRVIAENEQSQIEGKPAQGTPMSFTTEPVFAPTIEPGSEHATNLRSQSATLEANINGGGQETTVVFEYATTEAELLAGNGTKVTAHAGESDAIAEGLTPATNYYMRVTATNPSGTAHSGAPVTFETPPAPLVEETLPEALEITPRTAVIANITINPQFEEPVEPGEEPSYYITYGETTSYGQALPAPTHEKAGYGHTAHKVPTVELYGLKPATTYHYAIIAHNPNGTTSSTDHQFTTAPAPPLTTPPAVGNSSAQFTSENSTTIEGEVNPEGQTTTYHVEYGTSTSYGSSAPGPATLAPFTSSQGTITAITGLAPGTTYHYRIAATNAAGTGYGPDATFATSGAARTGTFTSFTVPAVPQIAVTPFKFPAETANTQSPSIEVVSHKVKGKTATIEVSVPAAGKLVATGKGVSKGTAKASKAGDVTVKVTLGKKGQQLLKKHPGRKLEVKVTLTFTSKKGPKLKTTTTVFIG